MRKKQRALILFFLILSERWLCFSVILFTNIKSHTWAQIQHKCDDVNRPVKDLFETKQSKSPWLAWQWNLVEKVKQEVGDTDLSVVVKGVEEDSDPIPLVGRTVHWPVEALSRGEPHSLLGKDKVLLNITAIRIYELRCS